MEISQRTRDVLVEVVAFALQFFETLPPDEIRQNIRYEADGSVSYPLGLGVGVKATMALHQWLASNAHMEIAALSAADELPRWFGTAFGSHATDITSYIVHLAATAHTRRSAGSVQEVVDSFVMACRRGTVNLMCTAFLEAHTRVPDDLDIPCSNGVRLRALSNQEIETLYDHGIAGRPALDPFSNRLVMEFPFTATLVFDSDVTNTHVELWASINREFESVHAGIHAFKSCSIPVSFYRLHCLTLGVPFAALTMVKAHNLPSVFVMSPQEADELARFLSVALLPMRGKLQLAMRRLRDSENRSSDVDSVIDSFVGIEALLNPGNAPELTLRVALNYSTLGPVASAQERFRELRDLYKVRSKIVHGDEDVSGLYRVGDRKCSLDEIARRSIDLLRRVVHQFVNDPDLRSVAKLDTSYWEARYFDRT